VDFEPKIITFLCTWCSYTGADSAGIARLKTPANVRAIRVPCSGRVAPEIIMRTFDQGADGVLVLGCHIGECHYDSGNHRTAKRIPILRSLMTFTGLVDDRLRLDWVSASEGERFSRIVNEFTDTVKQLGPIRWRVEKPYRSYPSQVDTAGNAPIIPGLLTKTTRMTDQGSESNRQVTANIQSTARELLDSGQVTCVIGYEIGTHGRTRPAFVYSPEEVERLVWNQDCTHNLTTYLNDKLTTDSNGATRQPIGIVVKPCDSRSINVHLAENRYNRDDIHIIAVSCNGIRQGAGTTAPTLSTLATYQERCLSCSASEPVIYDTYLEQPRGKDNLTLESKVADGQTAQLDSLSPQERMDFWLGQYDLCIRCYACRQVCPSCDCPICLYERDDSLWVGLGIGINEKRTFHLGRAFHLAGRCVECNECERVCPVGIPISLLNRKLAQEMENLFDHSAGEHPHPPPLVTILGGQEHLP
jgi:coenzyme F420-reducing hydrogenase delta subunit/ferredoxin